MTNNLYLARGDSKKRNEKKAAEEFTTSTYYIILWQASKPSKPASWQAGKPGKHRVFQVFPAEISCWKAGKLH